VTANIAIPNTLVPSPMWTREGRQEPFAWYRNMREREPVAYHEPIGAWGVFRYEDVRAIYADDVKRQSRRFCGSIRRRSRFRVLPSTTLQSAAGSFRRAARY
jgi:hypothetical protein